MKWWKRFVEKYKKFIEDTGKANQEMWKGRKPSCCSKDKNNLSEGD